MFKKSLYVATALITFAFTLPAQAQDSKHGNRADRHEYQDRYDDREQERHDYRHHHHDIYYEEAHYHQVEYRDARRYDDDDDYDHRHHHHHHVYGYDPHLFDHFVVSVIFR